MKYIDDLTTLEDTRFESPFPQLEKRLLSEKLCLRGRDWYDDSSGIKYLYGGPFKPTHEHANKILPNPNFFSSVWNRDHYYSPLQDTDYWVECAQDQEFDGVVYFTKGELLSSATQQSIIRSNLVNCHFHSGSDYQIDTFKGNTMQVQKEKNFADKLVDIIPFIDPDTTRFHEWLWAIRNRHNQSTSLFEFSIPDYYDPTLTLGREVTMEVIKKIQSKISSRYSYGQCSEPTVYDSRYYWRYMITEPNGMFPALSIVVCVPESGKVRITVVGDHEVVEVFRDDLENRFEVPDSITVQELLGFRSDGTPVIERRVRVTKDMLLPPDSFYPFLGNVDEFIQDYFASKSAVLLLIGAPGTGKSSLIRRIFAQWHSDQLGLIADSIALDNPGAINFVRQFPNPSLVAIEDADKNITKREDGNRQMTAILNHAEGVVSNDNKLVVSTNLSSTRDIDPALYRTGRGFRKAIEFRLLTIEEALQARSDIGKPDVSDTDLAMFSKTGTISLADALNYEELVYTPKVNSGKIGFGE